MRDGMFYWLSMFDVSKPYQKTKILTFGGGVALFIPIAVMMIFYDMPWGVVILAIVASAATAARINK